MDYNAINGKEEKSNMKKGLEINENFTCDFGVKLVRFDKNWFHKNSSGCWCERFLVQGRVQQSSRRGIDTSKRVTSRHRDSGRHRLGCGEIFRATVADVELLGNSRTTTRSLFPRT